MVYFCLLFSILCFGKLTAQTISTVAGNGTRDFAGDGGPPAAASLAFPAHLGGDSSGALYITDTGNHRIRRINAAGDTLSTWVGDGNVGFSGDGSAPGSARLNGPGGLWATPDGTLYIADTGNHRIRRVNAAGTAITTVAGSGNAGFAGDDSLATAASLNAPAGVFVDSTGNIYIADTGNHRIRKIASNGVITTVAGDGDAGFAGDDSLATAASLNAPAGVFVDSAGNIYIADTGNHRIRRISAADSTISTVAGSGTPGFGGDGGDPKTSNLTFPQQVWAANGAVYIADRFNHRIRRINPGGDITSLGGDGTTGFAGDGQAANRSRLSSPSGLYLDGQGRLFVADTGNHRIRRIDPDATSGINGSRRAAPGDLARLLSIGFSGDGQTRIDGLVLTLQDTSGGSGLSRDDIQALHLYASDDSNLDAGDTLVGQIPGTALSLGQRLFLPTNTTVRPATDQRRFFIAAALFDSTATEGSVVQVGFETGGLATTSGGRGTRIEAGLDRIRLDIVATRLVLRIPPLGATSGLPLQQQPVLEARDDVGRLDGDFSDTLRASVNGQGIVLQAETVAVDGVAAFERLTYTTDIDNERFEFNFDDTPSGAEGDLAALSSAPLDANLVNDPPRVTLPRLNLREDEEFFDALSSVVQDPDDTQLRFTFTSQHIIASVHDDTIRIRPEANWSGIDTLSLVVTDPFGLEGSDRVPIQVRPINDPPVSLLPDTLVLAANDTLVIDLAQAVADVDHAPNSINWTFTPPPTLEHRIDAGHLYLWATQAGPRQLVLPVILLDPAFDSSRDTVTVTITAANQVPVLSLPDTALVQGNRLALDLRPYGSDPDGDDSNLRWSVSGGVHLNPSFAPEGLGSITPDSTFAGIDTLKVEARDPDGGSTLGLLVVEVRQRNQTPRLADLPSVRLTAGDSLLLPLAALVEDDDPPASLQWSVSVPPSGLAFFTNDVLTLISDSARPYIDTLVVEVRDPAGQIASARLAVEFKKPMAFSLALPDTAFSAGDSLVLALDDFLLGSPAGPLSWNAAGTGLRISIDPLYQATFKTTGAKGPMTAVFTATDTSGHSTSDTLQVTVLNPVPRLTLPDRLDLESGVEFSLDLDGFAVDDEPLDRLVWDVPPAIGLAVSLPVARRLLLLPAADFSGQILLPFAATDAQGAIGRDTVRVAVSARGDTSIITPPDTAGGDTSVTPSLPTNTPPKLNLPQRLLVQSGSTLSLALDSLVSDDGLLASLIWNASTDSLIDLQLDRQRRRLEITPRPPFTGAAQLRLHVSDLSGAADSALVTVQVESPPPAAVPSDFSEDGHIDLEDFFSLSDQMGSTSLHDNWDPRFDLDGDGQVGLDDFFIFSDAFTAQLHLRLSEQPLSKQPLSQ
jgi:sugar lactone lactonase YvrE